MKLIKGGNCTLASAAMCMDMTYDKLHRLCPETHSIAWPDAEGQLRERGVTMDEINDLGIKLFLQVNCLPIITNGLPGCTKMLYTEEYAIKRMRQWMSLHKCILIGKTASGIGHAVAWDRNLVYDPRGYICDANDMIDFQPQHLFAMIE